MLSTAGNMVEEQRALATIGRTYFVQSQSVCVGEEVVRGEVVREEVVRGETVRGELLLNAGTAYLRSLDVCDQLGTIVPDK